MGQYSDLIEQMYDSVAQEWAEAFADEHEKKPKDREVLLRFADCIGTHRPVWDLGCGPGNTAGYLHDLGIQVSGLDLSEKILEQARRAYPEVTFRKGDILNLDFNDGTIAGIVAFYAIVHLTKKQVEEAFREIFRVLQPKGLFLCTFHVGEKTLHLDRFLDKEIDIDFMFFSTNFIRESLQTTGFRGIEMIEREPYRGVEYESRRAYVFATKPGIKDRGEP